MAICWATCAPLGANVLFSEAAFLSRVTRTDAYILSAKRPRLQIIACQQVNRSAEDIESLGDAQRRSNAFFERLRKVTEAETTLSNPLGLKKSYEVLRVHESDGEEGPRDRYVYVEERDCIGCTHCAATATGTFFMEEDYGRARVFDQLGDVDAVIEEAIDTCPVNCIYYVDWRDLIALEDMRDHQKINKMARLVGGQDFGNSIKGTIKTSVMDSGSMRCENCPNRGCGDCPQYGVGNNPEYLRKKALRAARAQKRSEESGMNKSRRRI